MVICMFYHAFPWLIEPWSCTKSSNGRCSVYRRWSRSWSVRCVHTVRSGSCRVGAVLGLVRDLTRVFWSELRSCTRCSSGRYSVYHRWSRSWSVRCVHTVRSGSCCRLGAVWWAWSSTFSWAEPRSCTRYINGRYGVHSRWSRWSVRCVHSR